MSFGKTIGILASVASIGGFAFLVYEKTQIDPSREQLNRLTRLVETQEQQLELQKELVSQVARLGGLQGETSAPVPKSTDAIPSPGLPDDSAMSPGAEPGPDARDQAAAGSCRISNPTNELIVHSVNVRAAAPTLGSLAPRIGVIFRGDRYVVTDTKAAGILGFGAVWQAIEYCSRDGQRVSGWIADKLENGSRTNRPL